MNGRSVVATTASAVTVAAVESSSARTCARARSRCTAAIDSCVSRPQEQDAYPAQIVRIGAAEAQADDTAGADFLQRAEECRLHGIAAQYRHVVMGDGGEHLPQRGFGLRRAVAAGRQRPFIGQHRADIGPRLVRQGPDRGVVRLRLGQRDDADDPFPLHHHRLGGAAHGLMDGIAQERGHQGEHCAGADEEGRDDALVAFGGGAGRPMEARGHAEDSGERETHQQHRDDLPVG